MRSGSTLRKYRPGIPHCAQPRASILEQSRSRELWLSIVTMGTPSRPKLRNRVGNPSIMRPPSAPRPPQAGTRPALHHRPHVSGKVGSAVALPRWLCRSLGPQVSRGGEDRPHGWGQRCAHRAVLLSRYGPRIMPPITGPGRDTGGCLAQPIAAMGLDLGCLLRPCHGTSLGPAFPRRRSDCIRVTRHMEERRMKRVVAIILGGEAEVIEAELIRATCLVWTAEELIEQMRELERQGLQEVMFATGNDEKWRFAEAFSRQVMARL